MRLGSVNVKVKGRGHKGFWGLGAAVEGRLKAQRGGAPASFRLRKNSAVTSLGTKPVLSHGGVRCCYEGTIIPLLLGQKQKF
jgi:hypothetical protein